MRRRIKFKADVALLLFIIGVVGADIWNCLPRHSHKKSYYLSPRKEISGYRFKSVRLAPTVNKILCTTNLLNGHFFDFRSNRFSVLSAKWEPGQGTVGELFHTPDACWTGQGFELLESNVGSRITFQIHDRSIPFECRILKHPERPESEIVVWAVCLDGHWNEVQFGVPPTTNGESNKFANYFRGLWRLIKSRVNCFGYLISHPPSKNSRKQFIRISIAITAEPQTALSELKQFACKWLEIRNTT